MEDLEMVTIPTLEGVPSKPSILEALQDTLRWLANTPGGSFDLCSWIRLDNASPVYPGQVLMTFDNGSRYLLTPALRE
jgi:hypothetical protein